MLYNCGRMSDNYQKIHEHYERCFSEFGDSPKGVDWPNEKDAMKRYEVMLNVLRDKSESAVILDIGCGAGHMFEYLQKQRADLNFKYLGLDISEVFIAHCRSKFPQVEWIQADLLKTRLRLQTDYAIMNGVFTEKLDLSFDEMLLFWKALLKEAFTYVRKGLVFNVMSTQVDWQRDDLFHLPLDTMANFVTSELSRHFVVRRDYGLYEYSVYVYKNNN
jgi:SAM-dependent methyltransferase